MTAPAGTFQTFQSIGNREDLTDAIYMISPTEFPFTSMAGRSKASGVKHEWQTDALATASTTNAAIEGDDATILTATPTVRLANYCQILTKSISISGTEEAINKAGRKSELAYQIAKRGKELRRDLEAISSQNLASTAGAAASARAMASLEGWLFTNRTDLGASGSPTTPGFISGIVAAPTDNSVSGTFTKAGLDAVIQACWTQGGDPKHILTGPFNKTKASTFTGIATLYKEVPGMKQGVIVGGADVYVSNFGEHTIVPSRFNRDKTVCVLDMEYWALAYLRPFQQFALAKTGDSEKRQMLVEVTLESKNEAASGKVTSLTTA
jgi:hypothetical protein